MDLHLERLLRQHRQLDVAVRAGSRDQPEAPADPPPRRRRQCRGRRRCRQATGSSEAALLLLDQARILEGEPVADAIAFARRMTAMMERGMPGEATCGRPGRDRVETEAAPA